MTSVVGFCSAQEFFQKALLDAMTRERVAVSAHASWYLVGLLERQVCRRCNPGESLSMRFSVALSAPPRSSERFRLLRAVGDDALASFLWWEREFRPLRDNFLDLYRTIGSRAYWSCADEPFRELAMRFERLADVMVRFAAACPSAKARDIVRLYRLWEATQSRYAAHALAECGIMVGGQSSTAPS